MTQAVFSFRFEGPLVYLGGRFAACGMSGFRFGLEARVLRSSVQSCRTRLQPCHNTLSKARLKH